MSQAKKMFSPSGAEGGNVEGKQTWLQYGSRLVRIRGEESQAAFAPKVGVHKNTLGHYERGTRELGADALRSLVYRGWNANWVLTGEGPERLPLPQEQPHDASQDLSGETLSIATELADETLKGLWLPKHRYFELVALIYDALSQGLPYAEIITFARPAAAELAMEKGSGSTQGLDKPSDGGPAGGEASD